MKKILHVFTTMIMFSTSLFSYYLGQRVPVDFSYNYWNKNASFENYTDIKDAWLCSNENSEKCTCDIVTQNPQCLLFEEDSNSTISINETLKKEKFTSLSLYDINNTYAEVDNFQGYDQNKAEKSNINGHPLLTSQGEYIIFKNNSVRIATDQEVQDLLDFVTAMSDPESLIQDDITYHGDYEEDYVNGNVDDAQDAAADFTEPEIDTSSNIAQQAGTDPDEMNDIQNLILTMGENLYYETTGEHSFMSDGGEVDFQGDINNSFLQNYVGDSTEHNKILGQLGIGGSINCYGRKEIPKLKPINMQMCIKKDGVMKKNDYSYQLSGGFNAETVGKPICKLKGDFIYNPSDETCVGCGNPSRFLDIENNRCYDCKENETYDEELHQCVSDEFSYKELAIAEDGGNTYEHFWIARCSKNDWTTTMVYTGENEVEPPDGLACGGYGKKEVFCDTSTQSRCLWSAANPLNKSYAQWNSNYSDPSSSDFLNERRQYKSSLSIKTPNPYKNEKGVLDYRLNMGSEGAVWGKEERKKQAHYGGLPFFRKYTLVTPMPYAPKVEKHGWTFLRSLKDEGGSNTFARWKELEIDWDRGDVKYASYLKFQGTEIDQRMFVCKDSKFYWWSNDSQNEGDEVGYLNINTCNRDAAAGWNAAFDNTPIEVHSSKYTMGNVLEEGKNIIKFGVYNPSNDKNDVQAGKVTLTYAYRPRRAPDSYPIEVSDVEWEDNDVGIGCNVEVTTPPFPDVCVTLESSADIHKTPNSPIKIGENVNMTPAQTITANFTDAIATLSSKYVEKEDNDNMFYPSGITKATLNNATDINVIFADEEFANSSIGDALLSDDSEKLALVKSYIKTEQAKKNAFFLGSPNENTVTKEITKVRPDFLGLPNSNLKVEEAIATISKLLSDDYNILNFEQNTLIFFNAQFSVSESIPEVKTISDVEQLEQKVFKAFVESNSTVEAKALIEKKNAEKFVAIQTVSNGNRIASPTLQRLPSLSIQERLPYIALSKKQLLKDAYMASVFSRIGRLKTEIFDASIEAARVNAKPVYGKVMSNNLNTAIKWSEDKIR